MTVLKTFIVMFSLSPLSRFVSKDCLANQKNKKEIKRQQLHSYLIIDGEADVQDFYFNNSVRNFVPNSRTRTKE
jgi:hypothetical protein